MLESYMLVCLFVVMIYTLNLMAQLHNFQQDVSTVLSPNNLTISNWRLLLKPSREVT
jgi:hypothetical protein